MTLVLVFADVELFETISESISRDPMVQKKKQACRLTCCSEPKPGRGLRCTGGWYFGLRAVRVCEGGWSVVRVLGGSCGGRLQMGFRRCAVSVVVLSWWFVFSGKLKG